MAMVKSHCHLTGHHASCLLMPAPRLTCRFSFDADCAARWSAAWRIGTRGIPAVPGADWMRALAWPAPPMSWGSPTGCRRAAKRVAAVAALIQNFDAFLCLLCVRQILEWASDAVHHPERPRFTGCHLRARHKKKETVTLKVVISMRLSRQAVAKLQSEIFYLFPYKARRHVPAASWPCSQRHSDPDPRLRPDAPFTCAAKHDVALANSSMCLSCFFLSFLSLFYISFSLLLPPSPFFFMNFLRAFFIVFCCWQLRVCFQLIAHIVNWQPEPTQTHTLSCIHIQSYTLTQSFGAHYKYPAYTQHVPILDS